MLVGCKNFPIGYILGTENGFYKINFSVNAAFMDVVYYIGDAANKVGFGFFYLCLALSETSNMKVGQKATA